MPISIYALENKKSWQDVRSSLEDLSLNTRSSIARSKSLDSIRKPARMTLDAFHLTSPAWSITFAV